MNTKNQYLFILCGEAFSGKSTLSEKISEKYEAKIVGRDKVYFAVEDILALEGTPGADDADLWENLWPIAVQGAKNQLLLGHSVVFDDTCLFLNQREGLRSIARNVGVKCVLIYFEVPAETRKKRKEQNKISKIRHDVPSGWLEEDAKKFERPTEIENPIIYSENNTFDDLQRIIGSYE